MNFIISQLVSYLSSTTHPLPFIWPKPFLIDIIKSLYMAPIPIFVWGGTLFWKFECTFFYKFPKWASDNLPDKNMILSPRKNNFQKFIECYLWFVFLNSSLKRIQIQPNLSKNKKEKRSIEKFDIPVKQSQGKGH